jgi:hypothetical protein
MNMKVLKGRSPGVRVLKTEASAISSTRGRGVSPAVLLSAIVAVLMLGASVLGIVVHDLYRDGAWAREAFRAGDVVTLVLVVPVLITSLALGGADPSAPPSPGSARSPTRSTTTRTTSSARRSTTRS